MADKAAFESLVGLENQAVKGMQDTVTELLKPLIGDYDFVRILAKPEFQRLLASREMRDAIDVSEIPLIQTAYDELYAEVVAQKSFAFTTSLINTLIIPGVVLVLLLIFAYLLSKIIGNWKREHVAREEKKRIRQLKKENAEAQRRLQQQKVEKKRS